MTVSIISLNAVRTASAERERESNCVSLKDRGAMSDIVSFSIARIITKKNTKNTQSLVEHRGLNKKDVQSTIFSTFRYPASALVTFIADDPRPQS